MPPTATASRRDYYVYILFRRDGSPFYVGKGSGTRFSGTLSHWTNYNNPQKRAAIIEMRSKGLDIPAVKIAEGLSNEEAHALEKAFIGAIGRQPNGPLLNRSSGGEGCREHGILMRARIASASLGRRHTPEAIEKIRQSRLGKKGPSPSEETRLKLRLANLGKIQPPSAIALTVAANVGSKRSPEARRKMREAKLGKKKSPEAVEKSACKIRGKKRPPEVVAKVAAARWSHRTAPCGEGGAPTGAA